MLNRKWTVFSGLMAVLLVGMMLLAPASFAQENGDGEGKRGGRMHGPPILQIAADEMGLTREEMKAELEESEDRSIADVAAEYSVSTDTIVDAVMADVAEKMAERVADGTITQEEADEKMVEIREKVTEKIEEPFTPRGPGKHQGKRGPSLAQVAADEMGLTREEMRAELEESEGRSIADVAAEYNVSNETIIDAFMDQVAEKIAEKVADGSITQEEADERLAEIREKVTEKIEEPFTPRERGERPQRGNRDGATR